VGLAIPSDRGWSEACAAASSGVGLAGGALPLAQAALYLAGAEKANTRAGFFFFDAIQNCSCGSKQAVFPPTARRNRDGQASVNGQGYRYPHLPTSGMGRPDLCRRLCKGKCFWQPASLGWRRGIGGQGLPARRAAQPGREAPKAAPSRSDSQQQRGPPPVRRWLQRRVAEGGSVLESSPARSGRGPAGNATTGFWLLEARSPCLGPRPSRAPMKGAW